ncbi:hypothetical protein [Streptomyces tendae]|uniref:hypothetical protein n=1 Tax=Streptomyces tendae TaxID=1932 RepID=UPI0034288D66
MTAGPDERTLHVIPGGGPETEEEAEARIREDLHRRGVGPGGPASSAPPLPPHPPTVPEHSDAVPEHRPGQVIGGRYRLIAKAEQAVPQQEDETPDQAPPRAVNDRLVPWWSTDKPRDLDDSSDQHDPVSHTDPDGDQDDGDGDEEPQPEAKERGLRPTRRRAAKTSRPVDNTDPDDEAAGEERLPDGPRWSRPALGRPPGLPAKKKNLIAWWREDVKPEHKWLMYHGTGLGAGIYFGVFTYGTRGAEYVTQEGLDDLEADITLGLLGLVLLVDYHVRNLFPPLAWIVRAISTSLLLGAAWNGTPLADLTN